MSTDDEIRQRLIALRKRLGFKTQIKFAEALELEKNIYNPFEKGTRPLTLDAARRIRKRFGVSSDWLLFGDIGQPNEALALELGPAPIVTESEPAKKPKPKRERKARSQA